MHEKYFAANQKLWDAKTGIHVDSAFYDMSGFLKGKNSLRKIELAELPDLKGKTVLHSQCHFGQDTLSMQRMGAQCTGIDLSSKAIAMARQYNSQLGLNAKFVQCNVFDIDKHIDEQFDLVFTSYGVLGWLPDMEKWATQMASRVKEGGMFYIVEFHPTMYMFDWNDYKVGYPYFYEKEPTKEVEIGTYADRESDIELEEYFWQHHMGEIIQALIEQGLEVVSFQEYDYSPYQIFGKEVKRANQEYLFPVNNVNIPLTFSLKCIKK